MVKVYFQTKNHSHLVAIFHTDELYNKCVEALEKEAEKQGYELMEEEDPRELPTFDL